MLDKTRNIFIAISVLLTPLAQASEVSTSQAPTQKTVTQQTPQQRLSALLNGYQKACMSEECAKQLIQVKKYGRWGDAKSQLVLANAYLYGDGVEQNTDKAISWLKRAAYNSSANAGKYSQKARHMLAKIYQQGVGVEQDLGLANKHFTTLVEQQYGPVLFDNAFVEFEQDNVVQGIALLEQASASRFAQASYFLGRMYQQGEFVEKDISKAAGYYQKIVKTNYKDSRQRLTDIVDEMEVNTAQLSADEVAKNKALISKLTATLNIEVIQVNGNNMAAIDPMTNLVASLKQNRGKFTPATGSRIKGRGCGQTSQSCTSDTEEDIEDAINEGAVE